MTTRRRILLTGATGYVGGRLLQALRERGERVRCLVRNPDRLRERIGPGVELVRGDVLDAESLVRACQGVDAAYYLVHALGSRGDFEADELRGARNFATVARAANVGRLIYLGGLVPPDEALSPHLRSRQEVGSILRGVGVPCCELRASIIIGSGSLSFEMIRSLVQKLPVMTTPRWTRALAQPIAIEDVVAILIEALDIDLPASRVLEIGGPDRVSYSDLMLAYAEARGLRRRLIPVPALTPRLSSLWLGLVTPLYARVGRRLIDSLRHDTVVTDPAAAEVFSVRPRGVKEAIHRAIVHEDRDFAATRWCDALSSSGPVPSWGGERFGSRLVDSREVPTDRPPAAAFAPIRRLGGDAGWYYGRRLWQVRGLLDRLSGGPGLRRGRRDPEHLAVGDTLDFWRVEAHEPDRLLRLRAEMKVPGRAWLQYEVEPDGTGSRIRQTALFDPRGLSGLVYWYALWPFHQFVFSGLLREIARRGDAAPAAARSARG